jgi:hypothetical protein
MGLTGGAVGAVLAPVVVTAGLGVLGFSAAGPVAGEFPTRLVVVVMRHPISRVYQAR